MKTSQLSDALLHGGISDQIVALRIEDHDYNVGAIEDLNGLTPTDTAITAATFTTKPVVGIGLAVGLDTMQDPNGEVQLYHHEYDAWYEVAEVFSQDGITIIRAGEPTCVG